MSIQTLRIGARGSRLAQIQAQEAAAALHALDTALEIEVIAIKTLGDRDRRTALADMGGQGIFTREIQDALARGEIDLAVHSLKDLPVEEVPGLTVAAVPRRQDARDAWISSRAASPVELPLGAQVGTGSLRREAFLRHHRPDLQVMPLRGNVETRLRRATEVEGRLPSGRSRAGQEKGSDADGPPLSSREQNLGALRSENPAGSDPPLSTLHAPPLLDGIILAAAGLIRLGLEDAITAFLEPPEWLPAPGQGAIALECRSDDSPTLDLVSAIDDPEAHACVEAERGALRAIRGGCQVPLGTLARMEGGRLHLSAALLSRDGTRVIRAAGEGEPKEAAELGARVGRDLLARGGDVIVEAIRMEGSMPGVEAP